MERVTSFRDNMDECEHCGSKEFITRQDAGGKYRVCKDCGLRQDGLGQLQKRFGPNF